MTLRSCGFISRDLSDYWHKVDLAGWTDLSRRRLERRDEAISRLYALFRSFYVPREHLQRGEAIHCSFPDALLRNAKRPAGMTISRRVYMSYNMYSMKPVRFQ